MAATRKQPRLSPRFDFSSAVQIFEFWTFRSPFRFSHFRIFEFESSMIRGICSFWTKTVCLAEHIFEPHCHGNVLYFFSPIFRGWALPSREPQKSVKKRQENHISFAIFFFRFFEGPPPLSDLQQCALKNKVNHGTRLCFFHRFVGGEPPWAVRFKNVQNNILENRGNCQYFCFLIFRGDALRSREAQKSAQNT